MTTLLISAAGMVGCAGAPEHFIQNDNEFTPCSSAPRCVSSQAERGSSKYVKPFAFSGDVDDARKALLRTIEANSNAKIVRADERFVHSTFSTTIGFVDDVTFLLQPEQQIIDVKSSARIGYYDFNTNRKRVERLRGEFQSALKKQ